MPENVDSYTHALSVDIGGTFTDFSLLDLNTGEVSVNKVLTDPDNPEQALMTGANQLLESAGLGFGQLRVIVHSTTLATNAIIERKGAKSALLTTRGFRDTLEMGREQIYDMYDLKAQLPPPIVPRHLRRELSERTDRAGVVSQHPDQTEVVDAVKGLVDEGTEALAVSFLHSYRNPSTEQAVKALIESQFPDLVVSLSSEVAPVINEYERTSTTVADCYIKPAVARYLGSVAQMVSDAGYEGRLLVMHSAGGVMDSDSACQFPIRLLESGPAAGALAASFYSQLLGQSDLISLDMGGTTAKTCVIEGGEPAAANNIEVARVHRFTKGSGLPILIPVVDLVEIGAGGGSIAWIDNLGLLKVGPQSAGAVPGPACYDNGGVQPTVTDANLILGYLNSQYFLGGKMRLNEDAAGQAISSLAESMGMSEVQAAAGIYGVVTESMAASARLHIIGRNKDPRNYAITAFGGAGPAHASEVARILGVKQVIVPLAAGVTSAVGCLTAPLSFEGARSLPALLEETDWDEVNQVFAEMEQWGLDMLQSSGASLDAVEVVRSADMRLVGQIHEINVPVPAGIRDSFGVQSLEGSFHQVYQALYSRTNLNIPIEVQNWKVLVRAPQPAVRLREEGMRETGDAREALTGTRPVYFQTDGQYVDCQVYDRYRLLHGHTVQGPAIIEERESTAVLGPRNSGSIDRFLNLIIDVG